MPQSPAPADDVRKGGGRAPPRRRRDRVDSGSIARSRERAHSDGAWEGRSAATSTSRFDSLKTAADAAWQPGPREEVKEYSVNFLFWRRLGRILATGWDWPCFVIVAAMMGLGVFQAYAGTNLLTPLGSEVTVATLHFLQTKASMTGKGLCDLDAGHDQCSDLHHVTRHNLWGGGEKLGFCHGCEWPNGTFFRCYGVTNANNTYTVAVDGGQVSVDEKCVSSTTQQNLIRPHSAQPYDIIPVGAMYLLWAFMIPTIIAFAAQFSQYLNFRIRRNVTLELHRLLLRRRYLHDLVTANRDIDNYDQRITMDIQYCLDGSFGPWFGFWCSCCGMYYGLKATFQGLWAFSHVLSWKFIGAATGFTALAFTSYLYSMNMISRVQFNQKAYEGSFRWAHSRVVEQSESVCLYGGEEQEKENADLRFTDVVRNYVRFSMFNSSLLGIQLFFSSFTSPVANSWVYMAGIGGNDVLNIQGWVAGGLNSIMGIATNYSSVAAGGGPVHRVGQLLERLRAMEAGEMLGSLAPAVSVDSQEDDKAADAEAGPLLAGAAHSPHLQQPGGAAPQAAADRLEFAGVTATAPGSDAVVFRDLSFEVRDGERLCIVGPSGSGKTAVLRLLEGMWAPAAGAVRRPPGAGRGGVFFLPQRAYVTAGTLREQVTYPRAYDDAGDDALVHSLLQQVDLGGLAARWGLDAPAPWAEVLSGGEAQRLCAARLLYHRPRFAVLDEATSMLSAEDEERVMGFCAERGITLISVAHRESMARFHKQLLRFDGQGGHALTRINK